MCNDIKVRSSPVAVDDHPRHWPPWQSVTWVVVPRVASGRTLRCPGVGRDHHDMELTLMLFACGGWHGGTLSPIWSLLLFYSACWHLIRFFCLHFSCYCANYFDVQFSCFFLSRVQRLTIYSGSFRQQMTIVEIIIIVDLHCFNDRHCVGLCVFV